MTTAVQPPEAETGFGIEVRPGASAEALLPAARLAEQYGLLPPSRRPAFFPYVRDVFRRRHFVLAYAHARSETAYARSKLGNTWKVLNPALNIAVFYLVFGLLLGRTEGTGESYLGFVATGVFIFSYTRDSFGVGIKAVSDRLGLIRSMYFPRAVLPLSVVAELALTLGASLVVTFAVLLGHGEVPSRRWLLMIPALLLQTSFNIGAALLTARIGATFRDSRELLPWILRVWMYLSGVMYSLEAHVQKAPHWFGQLLEVNPAAVYIELFRHSVLDGYGKLTPHVWALGVFWAVISPVFGWIYFWRGEDQYGRG